MEANYAQEKEELSNTLVRKWT